MPPKCRAYEIEIAQLDATENQSDLAIILFYSLSLYIVNPEILDDALVMTKSSHLSLL